MSVLVVGGTGIDTIVPVPALPVLGTDSVQVGPIHDFVAHTGTGVALALHALGVPVELVDAIGDDEPGRLIRAAFDRWGIPLRTALAPAGTRRAVNLMDPSGRRLSLYDARHSSGYRLPSTVYEALLPTVSHTHVSIMDWARHVLADVRAAGHSVSTDLHDWDGANPHHRDFAYGADLVFVSAAQLGERMADVVGDIFAHGVASIVVVTAGGDGAYLWPRESPQETVHQPAVDPGSPIVNTNGAGDAFCAAFLASWLDGASPRTGLYRAAVAGAFACTRDVGDDGFIDRATLDARAGLTPAT
jgi:sugar/nucleoside kinase (ribokinase family)